MATEHQTDSPTGDPARVDKPGRESINFFAELKRRNVHKVAVAYIVAGWALSQGIAQVFPVFDVPNWVIRSIVMLIIIGLPITLVLAWMFELTPQGIKRTEAASDMPESTQEKNAWIYVAAIGAAVSVTLFFLGRYSASRQTFAEPGQTLGPSLSEKSIAVLPFENLSRDPDNAYFATGIQDEILTRIAKIGSLKVISRNSTRQYAARPANLPDVAHQLAVANILEGSVQRVANQVHINVQLIRAATDEHLWAESYDRKLENIFGVEAEVATAVAEALNAKLTGAEQHALEQKATDNPKAYDAYLRGIALWGEAMTIDDLSQSIPPFEEAVRLDPNFAMGWAMLARLNSLWYGGVEAKPSRRAEAHKSLEAALRLQPDLPEVQLAQAVYQYWVLRDYEGARPAFERLLTKLPNETDIPATLVLLASTQGRWDESRAYVERAIQLNPRDRSLRVEAAYVAATTRDFAEALRYYDEALRVWPDEPYLIAGKASVYQSLGKLDQADALLKKLHPTVKNDGGLDEICDEAKLRRSYSDTITLLRNWLEQAGSLPSSTRNLYRRCLGDLQQLSGDVANANANYSQARDELEQALKEQPEESDSILQQLAEVYAGLGDSQFAMEYIERAISLRPASKDAWFGPRKEYTQARIAARFGQKDLAISILAHLLSIPYRDPITPARLRLDPDFDPLRGDPRFEKLVEQSASQDHP